MVACIDLYQMEKDTIPSQNMSSWLYLIACFSFVVVLIAFVTSRCLQEMVLHLVDFA